jgi:hypothetical protein
MLAPRWVALAVALFATGMGSQRPAPQRPQGSQAPRPTVMSVSPSSGPPGTEVAIAGLYFRPGAIVTVGGVEAEVREVKGNRILAVVGPHGPGRVSVEVENPDHGTGIRGWAFRYTAGRGGG